MTPTIGSLCTGYGGLDQGVHAVYGGTTAWVSDIDKGANKILAHRYPDVPNLGDFTKTDWSTVEPVDILTAGFPCQPVSNAGKRLGDDDERWLWDDVLRAVRDLRPGLLVLENVRGLLTARGGRLFGRVLGTLAHAGYDTRWCGLRAADVGAPHGRWRVFIAATDTTGRGRGEGRPEPTGLLGGPHASLGRLLPTPTARDHKGHNQRRDETCLTGALLPTPSAADGNGGGRYSSEGHQRTLPGEARLLPTPAVNDMGEGKTVEAWDEWTAKMKAAHGNGNGHGASLSIEAQRLLPTPTTMDAHASGGGYNGQNNVTLTDATVRRTHGPAWGDYAAAIARWELATRPACPPTETSPRGTARLAPTFSEWMMGLPAGWVTDVPDITRNEALKALGNGVVPQQAAAALQIMETW